ALDTVSPPVPMAVVAMGRFGGAELSYASDLDVLLVYESPSPDDFAVAEGAAEALVRLVKGPTPVTRLYLLDADLRPEGRRGPLARSLGGYRAYYRRWAQTWERQALLRARPVAGDPELARRFMEVVGEWVWRPLNESEVREIRRMKARVERERIPPREDPQFHLKLGRGSLSDVEWTAQLLQLRHRVPAPGTMVALARLEEAGALCAADAAALGESYRFCERARNRWYLIKGAPDDALPTQADQLARLAASLGTTASELRDRYRKVTRRARQVVERLFYGKDD
ncbi:MAG: bifunctional [glutamine synthetase] adenylyltransferase/[glutamine synthetase]-adenylyl-L-tyrosine phosphorylase, partial [Actinomycetota bacterium]